MRTNIFLKQNPPESHSWAGKVTFSFSYPEAGWIQFAILCNVYVQNVVIALSNAFNPFPEFIRWLNAIAEGHLPGEFIVDEEGVGKILRATPVNEEEFIFEVLEWLWVEKEKEERPIYLYVQVHRKQFLSEFLKRWDDFLENQYDPAEWEEHGTPSLSTYDVEKIRTFIGGDRLRGER
jgi:hypothetical protein